MYNLLSKKYITIKGTQSHPIKTGLNYIEPKFKHSNFLLTVTWAWTANKYCPKLPPNDLYDSFTQALLRERYPRVLRCWNQAKGSFAQVISTRQFQSSNFSLAISEPGQVHSNAQTIEKFLFELFQIVVKVSIV